MSALEVACRTDDFVGQRASAKQERDKGAIRIGNRFVGD